MKVKATSSILIILLLGCGRPDPNVKKIIDTGSFEIEVPASWKYKKEKGIDSFVGIIKGEDFNLFFDFSSMGYANHLLADEREFIYERKWEWMPHGYPYMEVGVTYTNASNVEAVRSKIMKERGIEDSSLVRVEEIQIPKEEITFKEGNYSVILTYQDTSIQVGIEIPEEIRRHNFAIDTIGTYKRKIITPKNGEKGMTGVYFEDLTSDFNFNLAGEGLSPEDQELAIVAFKTIKIKRR